MATRLSRKAVAAAIGAELVLGAAHLAGCGSASTAVSPSSTEKCAIGLTTSIETVDAAGGQGRLTIAAGRECPWSAASAVSWITIKSPAQGQGDGSVDFAVAPNTEPTPRTGALTVADRQISIAQRAGTCSYQLSLSSSVLPVEGGTRDVDVRASSGACEWTASSRDSWITITAGASGKGDGRVTFAVAATAGPPRAGSLTIADRTITVTQADGCSYTVAPSTLSVAASRVTSSVTVSSAAGCPWTAATSASWIALAGGSSGTGAGATELAIAANPGPARSGTVTIADRSVEVFQASGCTFNASPASLSVVAAGGRAEVRVASNAGCAWTAAISAAPWIAIATGTSGSGDGSVSLEIAPNAGPSRTAMLSVGGRTVAISQASGCTFQVTPSTLSFIYQGQAREVVVSSNAACHWTAASQASWMTLSPASGSGAGTIRVDAARNTGPQRTGTLSIAGRTVSAMQLSGCNHEFSPSSASFGPDGGTGKFRVTTGDGCLWQTKVVGGEGWVRVTRGDDGNGSGPVEFKVAPNTGLARTAQLVIENKVFPITQSGR